jgi:hypothetical protein
MAVATILVVGFCKCGGGSFLVVGFGYRVVGGSGGRRDHGGGRAVLWFWCAAAARPSEELALIPCELT